MPCADVKIGYAPFVVCGLPRRKKCYRCGNPSYFLCDYPLRKLKSGKWRTCDKALCAGCRRQGVSNDVDFCREHYPLAKAAYERRRAKLWGMGK